MGEVETELRESLCVPQKVEGLRDDQTLHQMEAEVEWN